MEVTGHRYPELDSLRGLAALTVVVGHFITAFRPAAWVEYWNSSPLRILGASHEAVVLFFLLSGFVLAVPYSRPSTPTYVEFMAKRICRIYLPYLAAMLIAAAADSLLHSSEPTGNPWIDQTWNQRPSMHLIIQHVLMLGHYDNVQLNTAFWSLIYEMRISLIYPFLYWSARNCGGRTLLPLVFLATMVAALIAQRTGSEGLCFNVLYASFFVVGILLYRNLHRVDVALSKLRTGARWAVIAMCIVCYEAPGAFTPLTARGSPLILVYLGDWLTLAGASGILVFAIHSIPFRRFLNRPVVLRLGRISYSTYLVHATVLFSLIRLFYRSPHFAWIFPAYLVFTYLGSEAFHFTVERPSMLLGRKLSRLLHERDQAVVLSG